MESLDQKVERLLVGVLQVFLQLLGHLGSIPIQQLRILRRKA